jgi:hypothetical protein
MVVVKRVVVERNVTDYASGYTYYVHLVTRLYLLQLSRQPVIPTCCTDPGGMRLHLLFTTFALLGTE